jgi:hypothetical protein
MARERHQRHLANDLGSIGLVTSPGCVAEYSGMKHTPIPAAIIV